MEETTCQTSTQNNDYRLKRLTRTQKHIKRSIDVFCSLVGIILLSPLFALISTIYLVIDNNGPILFKQERIGLNGKRFKILKFRSMASDAEERLQKDLKLYQKYIENNYKLEPEEDPRITKFGRFLRKTSIDELPQLINVLKGEMSLVGPRPVVEKELLEYQEKTDDFLSVKPGVTGFWQVSGRSDVKYPERVDLELYYVYNQSIYFDIKILLLTIVTVLTRKGAY